MRDWERQIAGLGRQIDDPEGLAQVLKLAAVLDAAIAEGVNRLRSEGFTDAEMGRAQGVTRQAVTKRWKR